ncbi:MAG: hypothetical protein ACI81P_001698 [Neolewinella sp.]|jgi:hypothetical protein
MIKSRLFNWVFYGHVWIALGATGLSWLTLRITYSEQNCLEEWPVLAFIFFATLGVYTLHRYLSFQRAGERPSTLRYGIVAQHPRMSLIIGGASVLIASGLGLSFINTIWPALLLALPLTIFYLTPPLKGWRRLRDLPYLKNIWVALAWTIMTVIVPVIVLESRADFCLTDRDDLFQYMIIYTNGYLAPLNYVNFYLEMVTRFLLTACVALLFDLRDLPLDRSQGVRTVAGERPDLHRQLVDIGLLTCAALTFFAVHAYVYFSPAFGLSLTYLLMVPVAFLTYRKTDENWYAVVVNGLLLLPPFTYWLMLLLGGDAGASDGI